MHYPRRPRLEALLKLADVESKRKEQLYRKGRPIWTKVNRIELLIGGGIVALIAAWVIFLLLA